MTNLPSCVYTQRYYTLTGLANDVSAHIVRRRHVGKRGRDTHTQEVNHRPYGVRYEYTNRPVPDTIRTSYKYGNKHSDRGPAVMYSDVKTYLWYEHGHVHRNDGPARVRPTLGHLAFHIHGLLHRDNGPALIDFDQVAYYCRGKLHRDNGRPAEIYLYGVACMRWYYHGTECRGVYVLYAEK